MLRKLLGLTLLTLLATYSFAQVGQGGLKGKVIDVATGEPLPFVNVILEMDGNQKAGGATDFDGQYNIKPLPPGKYDVKVQFVGYKPKQINGVVVNADKISFLDIKMETTAIEMTEFVVTDYAVPLIDKDNTTSGGTVSKEEILRMPGRSAAAIAETVGGVYSNDNGSGEQYIRGARSDANYYFIDGMKVRGSSALPQSSIEQVTVLMGGLPAQYGDVTGGVVSITTRGPSKEYSGGMEYVTSGYKLGDNVVGLDKFGYNLLEFSLTGPVWMKKDEEGKKTDPLVGFFLAGNATSIVDPRPSVIGYWQAKDDVLAQIQEQPIRPAPTGVGVFQNAGYLRMNDFEKVRTTPNTNSQSLNLNAKLDFNTGPKTNFTVGGTFNYSKRRLYNEANLLFNPQNNGERLDYTWRAFARFTQRFYSDKASENQKASTIKNAFYSLQIDFTQDVTQLYDPNHKDDFFKYGHYGNFRRFNARDYDYTTLGRDSATNRLGFLQTTFVDTLIGFTPGESNPIIANIISEYYRNFGWEGYDENGNPLVNSALADDPTTPQNNDFLRDLIALQVNGGLRNGDPVRSVYNMWSSPGAIYNNFQSFDNRQLRFTAQGSADIGDHAIMIGFEYEQRADRGFNIAPSTLWTVGRQLTNNHILNLDFSDPIVDEIFGQERFSYNRLNSSPGDYDASIPGENQAFFDYNLRLNSGFNPDGIDDLDFDNYNPEDLQLSYFNADELLRYYAPSNNYTYYGFNHFGEKQRTNPTLDDYFNARDDFGNYTRPVGAFRPIYISGFIQDKFSFDDLVFNVGLRVDRFDANQSVLKDPYVLFPTVRAGEEEALELADGAHPGNIGEDYVVYVDDVADPRSIVGYRNENTWYNAEGIEITDPSILETSSGIQPLLVDKTKTSSLDITSEAFEDYRPQNIFMPRISFSFPISDEALFFAHYDILTKRPTTGLRMDPHQYVYLESITYTLNNPNLQPERTIDYELGFQQKLTNSSSLKLATFYREMRDQVQLIQRTQAFPREYRTYDNIDFGTVKGLTVTYDLRRTGNIWMKAAYTLQFAEGTGSDPQTALSLVRAGRDNLRTTNPLNFDQRHTIIVTTDYRFASGKNYNGPVVNGKQILKNTGANFVINAGSGTPYSGSSIATGDGLFSGANAIIDGSINGARLPWQVRVDTRIDRDIDLTLGEGDKSKKIQMNVYFQILNLLNSMNVTQVYRFTGNPNDDGYLNASQYQQDIAAQNDPQSFTELYLMKINDPRFYALPRRVRMGVMLNF